MSARKISTLGMLSHVSWREAAALVMQLHTAHTLEGMLSCTYCAMLRLSSTVTFHGTEGRGASGSASCGEQCREWVSISDVISERRLPKAVKAVRCLRRLAKQPAFLPCLA